MITKVASRQPHFGMYIFPMPNVNTPEEKAAQKQVMQEMCDTFALQEGASISFDDAIDIQPRNPKVPAIKMPASVKVDNTTAEESILGRIQVFFQQRGLDVNPFQGRMESTGNAPFDLIWKAPVGSPSLSQTKKQLRMDPKKDQQPGL